MLSFLLFSCAGAQILYPQSTIYQSSVYQPVYQPSFPIAAQPSYVTTYYPAPLVPAQPAPQFLDAREQAVQNVVKGLNYALTLENLESAFYRTVNGLLTSDADFLRLAPRNGERFNLAVLRTRFREIGSHEDSHAATLTALVSRLCSLAPNVPNCAPVRPCAYNFNVGNAFTKDINAIVATAELLENTGVSAYDGAIASLIQAVPLSLDGTVTSASIVEAAATITTVEARHTAFLSTIRGLDPFPKATDTPIKPNEILCAAVSFFANPSQCPVVNTATC